MRVSFSKIARSFKSRILLTAFILITITAAALNYYFYRHDAQASKANLLSHGRILVQLLAQNSTLSLFSENMDDLRKQILTIFTEQNCRRVIIFDEHGRPLLNQFRDKQTRLHHADLLTPKQIFSRLSALPPPSRSVFLPGQMVVAFIEPITIKPRYSGDDIFLNRFPSPSFPQSPTAATQTLGYVALLMDTSQLQNQARIFLRHSIMVTVSIAFISCLLVHFAITFLTRPLAQLTREIAQHPSLPKIYKTVDKAESASFLGDFGDMISIIRQSYLTINDLKSNLEDKVRTRTIDLIKSNQELNIQKTYLEENNRKLAAALDELKTTQEQLIRSEKMAALGQLISGLAHEINNSMNFISGSLPLLKNNLKAQQKALPGSCASDTPDAILNKSTLKTEKLLANIEEGVKRITGVINDLRIFSHSSSGDMEMTNIISGLEASVAIIRHEIRKRIVIQEDYAPDFPKIRGRSGQLNQVFINLLLNAVQAIKDQGMITVKAWYDPRSVHIAISDTGDGIEPHILSQIFDPFFTTKEVGKGTGMGLGISYSIIKKHRGEIKVDSSPGEGTIFEIILPRS